MPGQLNEVKPGVTKKATIGVGETDLYIFEATGKEPRIEVYFKVLGVLDGKPDDVNRNYLLNYKALNTMKTFHTTDKNNLTEESFGFPIDPSNVSYLHGNSVVKGYLQKEGFFTVQIKNNLEHDFHYSIEVVTNAYRMVDFGTMIYDYVNTKDDTRYYELHVEEPGYVYLDMNTCMSSIKVYYENEDLENDKFKP